MSFLTQSHQVFFGRPVCLIISTSHVIQCLTQSLSSFRSTCLNHLNLLFLIIILTGSNPKSSLSSSLFFLSFSLTPHIHLIILISVWFSFNSCTATTMCLKNVPLCFLNKSVRHQVILIIWCATYGGNLLQMFIICPPCLKIVTALPCEMCKSYSRSLQHAHASRCE